ncbi:MAG: hypothetical protein CMJ83_10115 [Planctomycetes bacterium]|nr:hypothetical protein [Planctomycetota bacterium]
MNAKGDVIWEARPTGKDAFAEALASAKKLDALQAKAAKNPDDLVAAANAALLDYKGRSQRKKPDISEIEKHAQVEGADKDLVASFNQAKKSDAIMGAVRGARSDGGEAIYKMFKAGDAPPKGDRMEIAFYRYGVDGAIKAKDKEAANKMLEAFMAIAAKNPRFKERAEKDAETLRKQIADL